MPKDSPADIDITYPAAEVDDASLDLEILATSLEDPVPDDLSQAALDLDHNIHEGTVCDVMCCGVVCCDAM